MSYKLPIEFVESKLLHTLRDSIVDDLELTNRKETYNNKESVDAESSGDEGEVEDKDIQQKQQKSKESIYSSIYKPDSEIERKFIGMHSSYTTSDIDHLKCSQRVTRNMINDNVDINREKRSEIYDRMYTTWESIRHDEEFLEKYYYIDVDYFKFLNQSPVFLQVLSVYNLLSPVLSFLLPVVLLIIPFFIIKYNGIEMSLSNYGKLVADTLSKHPLGNVFNIFKEVPTETKMYSIVSVLFYFFSMYQNSMICYRFYHNFQYIHSVLETIKNYLNVSMENMTQLSNVIRNDSNASSSYQMYNHDMMVSYEESKRLYDELEKISPYSFSSFSSIRSKTGDIGRIMKLFHDVHLDKDVVRVLEYTFQCNCYIENIRKLSSQLGDGTMSECRLGGENLSIKDMGHPITENMKKDDIVKNDIEMSKNLIITGPNASGKTTILKGILLNVILSHQHGIGFYKEGSVIPIYVDIHCYLNIPDTSGRDSLFQAEARRCKEIIDNIENTHDEEENDTDDGIHHKTNSRHFCIFDELFSGTNPEEAISSSYGFIKYLLHTKRIDFALTTHLNSLCEKMEKENVKHIRNVMMETYDGSLDSNTEEEEEGEEEEEEGEEDEEEGEEDEEDGSKCQNDYCDFNYTYKMVDGVSKVKGGLKVLKDLKYPSSILRLF